MESFLAEEGILEEAASAATKKVIAAQIAEAMKQKGLTKTAMAGQIGTARAQLDRLLDPDNDSVTLATLKRAARPCGLNSLRRNGRGDGPNPACRPGRSRGSDSKHQGVTWQGTPRCFIAAHSASAADFAL